MQWKHTTSNWQQSLQRNHYFYFGKKKLRVGRAFRVCSLSPAIANLKKAILASNTKKRYPEFQRTNNIPWLYLECASPIKIGMGPQEVEDWLPESSSTMVTSHGRRQVGIILARLFESGGYYNVKFPTFANGQCSSLWDIRVCYHFYNAEWCFHRLHKPWMRLNGSAVLFFFFVEDLETRCETREGFLIAAWCTHIILSMRSSLVLHILTRVVRTSGKYKGRWVYRLFFTTSTNPQYSVFSNTQKKKQHAIQSPLCSRLCHPCSCCSKCWLRPCQNQPGYYSQSSQTWTSVHGRKNY